MGIGNFLSNLFGGSKADYSALIKSGAIVIDVRSPQEFKAGRFKGSKNIPLNKLEASVKSLKNKEVILVCKSGGRAGAAKATLTKHGIKAHNAGAWQNLNKIN